MEAAEREAEGQAARATEVARRADRLAGEGGELQAALEQKQELVAALQVGGGCAEERHARNDAPATRMMEVLVVALAAHLPHT